MQSSTILRTHQVNVCRCEESRKRIPFFAAFACGRSLACGSHHHILLCMSFQIQYSDPMNQYIIWNGGPLKQAACQDSSSSRPESSPIKCNAFSFFLNYGCHYIAIHSVADMTQTFFIICHTSRFVKHKFKEKLFLLRLSFL